MIAGKEIFILNTGYDRLRKDLWRVMQSLLLSALERAGYRLFHASGVCTDRGVVAFAGWNGTGKTSLALAAVAHGAKFMGNDRLLIAAPDGGVSYARGWGDPIRMIKARSPNKETVSLRRYFAGCSAKVETKATPLFAVVFPDVRGEVVTTTIREIDPEPGWAMLKQALLPVCAKWMGSVDQQESEAVAPPCPYIGLRCSYSERDRAFQKLMKFV